MTDDLLARQLVNQAQEISRLHHDLDELANEYAQVSADLLARIEESGTTGSAAAPAAWCWRDAGPQAAEELCHSSAGGSPGSAAATPGQEDPALLV